MAAARRAPRRVGARRAPKARASSSSSSSTGRAPARPRVVVLGGGFGGLYTALRLGELRWDPSRVPEPEVTLVDAGERFVFKPLLYELLAGECGEAEVAPTFEELLAPTGVRFLRARVEGVEEAEDRAGTGGTVRLADGGAVDYDVLVVALGAEAPSLDAVPGAKEHALPFMTLGDARRVRARLDELGGSARAVVVGAGLSGVELAATLARLGVAVRVVSNSGEVMRGQPVGQRGAARRALDRLGVTVETGTVAEVTGGGVRLADGAELAADAVLWTVGAAPVPPVLPSAAGSGDHGGALDVEPTLRVRGRELVFALGDGACDRAASSPLPRTAQVAFQSADYCAWNVWAALNGRPLLPFRYQHLGDMMALGSGDAAVALPFGDITVDGPAAAILRRVAYAYRMPTAPQRLRAGAAWLEGELSRAIEGATGVRPPTLF